MAQQPVRSLNLGPNKTKPTSKTLSDIPQAPEDLMFGLSAAYRGDDHPSKVDLGVGAYRDDNGKPWILPVVKKAEERLRRDVTVNHEYLPIAGLSGYVTASQKLMLGATNEAIGEGRVASMQTLSGTGALYLGSLFLARFLPDSPSKRVYVSSPAYANHLPILHSAGLASGYYPYYDSVTKRLDFDGMLSVIDSFPEGSIVLLHACAHNPTGVDLTQPQWRELAQTMKRKGHLPFFDCAYQGFASGDIDADAWAIRHFVEQEFEAVMIAQSYAKNMGMYGERVGCLHVVASTSGLASRVLGQLKKLQRVVVSTPPAHGARIVSLVLNDEQLFKEWLDDLRIMSGRVIEMRWALRARLEANGTPGGWQHITDQRGMFCFSGLSEAQVMALRRRFHIYATPDGRFSISGLRTSNVQYVAEAIKAVVSQQGL